MAATEITWYGHACWSIKSKQYTLLIDPFLDESPSAAVKSVDVDADFILVTHGHFDHVGDTVNIAKRTLAQVICNFEVGEWFSRQGVEKVAGMNTGGAGDFPFGRVKLTIAHHSSTLPDGTPGGNPVGFLLTLPDIKIYIAGDTALTYDMKQYAKGLDVAILPIGDFYTMGVEDSVEAVKLLNPKHVLPSHYDTWPPIAQDAAQWARQIKEHTDAEPIVLKAGGTVSL